MISIRALPAVGEVADHTHSPPDLTVKTLYGVVGTDASPVGHRKPRVGARLGNSFSHALGGRFKRRIDKGCSD